MAREERVESPEIPAALADRFEPALDPASPPLAALATDADAASSQP
jgi:hypothetical protein